MPQFTLTNKYNNKPMTYASEQETLEFANRFREAGGGNLLDALLPAFVGNPSQCLLAKAFNFGGLVGPADDSERDETGSTLWDIRLDDENLARKIASELGLEVVAVRHSPKWWAIILPREIGNVAEAFDSDAEGWISKYRREEVG